MIDPSLTQEQQMLLHSVRESSMHDIEPVALEYDENGTYFAKICKLEREIENE